VIALAADFGRYAEPPSLLDRIWRRIRWAVHGPSPDLTMEGYGG
jgi:hypothetical protein